jgi:hypothetical protein
MDTNDLLVPGRVTSYRDTIQRRTVWPNDPEKLINKHLNAVVYKFFI